MVHRYYDPAIGRFISQDPAQDESKWYAYCGNNPLVAVDPSGLVVATLSLGGTAGAGDVGVTGDLGFLFSFPSFNPQTWDAGPFVDYGAGLYGGSPGVNAGPSASGSLFDTAPLANGTTHTLSVQATGGALFGGSGTLSVPLKTDGKGLPTGVDLKSFSVAKGVAEKTKVGGRLNIQTPGASVFAGKVTTHTVTVSTVVKGAASAITSAAKAVGGWWNARMTEAEQTVGNGVNNLVR
jgi:hypothetical protein